MIEEVKDLVGALKDKVGNTGFFLIIGGLVVAFIYFLTKDSGSSEVTYAPATNITGYPSVGENADVVASSVATNIQYAQQEMMDALEGVQESIQGSITETEEKVMTGMEATNNYIQEGLDAVQDLSNKVDTLETQPQVQYVPTSQPANNNNSWLGDMANFVTSNGMTLGQINSLMGTNYMGSTVTGVQTLGDGSTIISTKDGKKYKNGTLIN